MLTKKLVQRTTRAALSRAFAKKEFGSKGKKNYPDYDPMEFEPFKYPRERAKLMPDYTYGELFGIHQNIKHSNFIKKEMVKDNTMLGVAVLLLLGWVIYKKGQIVEFEDTWMGYYDHSCKEDLYMKVSSDRKL